MDIKYILEKAKELLIRDKKLMPVLFIERENEIDILGLVSEENINRIEIMKEIGKKFAEDIRLIKSISLVGDVYISKIDNKGNLLRKDEAIIVSNYNADTDKKEIIVQVYERSDDKIIWKKTSQELAHSEFYLLQAFMQGYNTEKMKKIHHN